MNLLLWLVALFLMAHGLIHLLYAAPTPPDSAGKWPFQLNRSWLLAPLGLGSMAKPVGTTLWVLAVAGFVLTGLGLLGVPILHEGWRTLALVSAALSSALLVMFWDRNLVVGMVINAVIVGVLLWNPSLLRGLA